jgi:hypothetical protein
MRNLDPGKPQTGPTPDAVQRRRETWRRAQTRAARFPQPKLNARRLPGRGAR